MLLRALLFFAISFLTFAVSAANHMDVWSLMSVAPDPNIKPTFRNITNPDGSISKKYQSGGIGILVYDGANAMDVLGPFQVFSSAGLRPFLVSASKNTAGIYKTNITFNSGIQITANRSIANTKNLEVLVVPGGVGETIQMAQNTEVLNWIKAIDQKTIYTSSVCTGSWILGAAGLLKGKHATSNWYRADELLTHFEAIPQPTERYVFDGKLVTSAGVTAGIDMALAIVKKVFWNDNFDGQDFTQAVMLDLQYDPNPPVTGGSPAKSEPTVFEAMQAMYDYPGTGIAGAVKAIPIQ